MQTNTPPEPLTEQSVRELLQVFTTADAGPKNKAFLGRNDLLFAVDESIFRRLHIDPNNLANVGPTEIAQALDAYLELSIELCRRLSQTERKIRETRDMAAALSGRPESAWDCAQQEGYASTYSASESSPPPHSDSEPESIENLESLCDFLKLVQKELRAYIRIAQEDSQKLSKASRYLVRDATPQLFPVAPLIA